MVFPVSVNSVVINIAPSHPKKQYVLRFIEEILPSTKIACKCLSFATGLYYFSD